MDERLSQFERKSYMNLETFRRTGEGVQTPVWFVQEAESFYLGNCRGGGSTRYRPGRQGGAPAGRQIWGDPGAGVRGGLLPAWTSLHHSAHHCAVRRLRLRR
jgi:hypothetical protein